MNGGRPAVSSGKAKELPPDVCEKGDGEVGRIVARQRKYLRKGA